MAQSFADALTELMGAKGISAKQLARRVEVDAAQVGRWRRSLGLPRPDNIIRVAAVLGVDYDWLLGLAYPETRATDAEPPDLIETAIRARAEEMREAVRDTPREFWPTIVKATFDRAIDGARDMAELLAAAAEPPVSAPQEPPLSDPERSPKRGDDATGDRLAPRQGAARLVVALSAF